MWAICVLFGVRPLILIFTVSLPLAIESWAVPLADSLVAVVPSRVRCTDWLLLVDVVELVIFAQAIGANWVAGETSGPLWTLIYQPLTRIPSFTPGIVVSEVPTPRLLAVRGFNL